MTLTLRGVRQRHETSTSMSTLIDQALPMKIVFISADKPPSSFPVDSNYQRYWVIVIRNGTCRHQFAIEDELNQGKLDQILLDAIDRVNESNAGWTELPRLRDEELPMISVIVPTIAVRKEDLNLCISSLDQLDYPDFEVIIVDNRREVPAIDFLSECVAGRPRFRIVRERIAGISAARNAGIVAATGSLVAFTDDDVTVDSGWLRAIATRFAIDPSTDIVTGLVVPSELETPSQIWFERYYSGFNGPRSFNSLQLSLEESPFAHLSNGRVTVREMSGRVVRTFSIYGIGAYSAGANMAFRKQVLTRAGGFDKALGTGTPARGGEDLAAIIAVLWNGGRMGYEPGALVHHRHRREYSELLNQMDGNGLGFTAMLTSLVIRSPKHGLVLIVNSGKALRELAAQWSRKMRGWTDVNDLKEPRYPLFPNELASREYGAYLRGPLAYFRSRFMHRSLRES